MELESADHVVKFVAHVHESKELRCSSKVDVNTTPCRGHFAREYHRTPFGP